jgi:hypothetical protein
MELDPELARLEGEELLPVGEELARAVNRRVGNRMVTAGSLMDAARIGSAVRGTGERLKLACVRVGRRRWSSIAAVLRFARAVAVADVANDEAVFR